MATTLGGCTSLQQPPVNNVPVADKTASGAGARVADQRTVEVEAVLQLSVIFYQRLGVPPGATLTVSVVDSKGRKVGGTTVTTTTGQPYEVSVPLDISNQQAVTVSVTLKSPAGHVLSGEKTFSQVPASRTEFLIAA